MAIGNLAVDILFTPFTAPATKLGNCLPALRRCAIRPNSHIMPILSPDSCPTANTQQEYEAQHYRNENGDRQDESPHGVPAYTKTAASGRNFSRHDGGLLEC